MSRLRSVAAMVGADALPRHPSLQPQHPPFITISRQAGAGGRTLMHALINRLRDADPADPPWTGYDRELVEHVAEQHHVHYALVERFGEQPPGWLDELIRPLALGDFSQGEMSLARRIAQAMRDLAERGRCVLVGRGGVFVTHGMPGGVHVFLVAPRAARVRHLAQLRNIPEPEAAREVDRVDRAREAFYRRYFPTRAHGPEAFTLTLNTAELDETTLIDTILAAIPALHHQLHLAT